ncbi:unnamed protein product [Lathyrus sativus]|nr:unnamed protein product [Lathyrus sativus]
MTKTMLVMFFSSLLICSLFTQNVDAGMIGNGAMGRNPITCNKNNPKCIPAPANPYNRGCGSIEKCRNNGGSSPPVHKGV